MSLRTSLAIACLLAHQASSARAETPDQSGAQADRWLDATLQQQRTQDIFGRYAAAPSAVAVGGLALIAPPLIDLPDGSKAAYMASGGLMIAAAIGAWANSDPYEAQRWFGAFASLGFVALGTGLALQETEPDSSRLRGMRVTLGASSAAYFLSLFVVSLVEPPPSPGALKLAVRDRSPSERYALVLDFLERRDHVRRLAAYVTLPWGFVMGMGFLACAHEAASADGRAVLYGAGGILLAATAVGLLYELLRDTDAERFSAGERP